MLAKGSIREATWAGSREPRTAVTVETRAAAGR
jgi:hypothetical protein